VTLTLLEFEPSRRTLKQHVAFSLIIPYMPDSSSLLHILSGMLIIGFG
jgi:hypothetical protein